MVATRQTVRWILILPAGVAAWYLALAVGMRCTRLPALIFAKLLRSLVESSTAA